MRWATRRGSRPSRSRRTRGALAARYPDIVQIVLGTTFGMMLAHVPAVFRGDKIAKKVSMPRVHRLAAVIFAILGLLTLLDVGKPF